MNKAPDVRTYYEDTLFDYRTIWNNKSNLACHFGYYDEHADKHHDALNNMNRALADLVKVMPGERVLDMGCGIGGSCFWLSEQRSAHATGISIVEKHIEECKKNALTRQAQNVDFIVSDFCQTPFPDASFDVVWAIEAQCHADRKVDFYREAFRVLRPGGRLVVADYIRNARPAAAQDEALLAGWLHNWAVPDIDTREEHHANAQTAGFQDVIIQDVTKNVRTSLRNLHELCTKWLPIGKVFRFFHIVNDVRLENVRASIRQYQALQNGAWFYTFIVAKVPPVNDKSSSL